MRAILPVLLLVPASTSAETVLSIATLAPEGSSLAQVIEASADRIAARTEGRIRVRIFWSGQLGDERDMVRRMRLGSLDGATLATAGIAQVAPEALVLQLPRLFRSHEELELVLGALAPRLDALAAANGFVVVAWSDLGAVHLVSRTPPRLGGLRAWLFPDEPYLRDLLLRLGARGSPMGVGEVTPSLTAGTIDAAYGPLLATVMLGWTPHIRFALDPPLAHAVAALVLSRAAWEKLTPADRRAVREVGAETAVALRRLARRDEERARRVLERHGVVFLTPPAAELARIDEQARLVAESHAPAGLIDEVRALLRDARQRPR